jgi:c(7)-type cytochrome triheme protein
MVRRALAALGIVALAAMAAGGIQKMTAVDAALGPVAPGGRPQMPAETALTQAPGSPGKVVFNHASHTDADRPDCTACHPRLFSILKNRTAGRTILHARMEKGQQCGACHDGKKSFGMDDCSICHRVG